MAFEHVSDLYTAEPHRYGNYKIIRQWSHQNNQVPVTHKQLSARSPPVYTPATYTILDTTQHNSVNNDRQ